MHLVVLGDVGVIDHVIHIGDEAMFEQFVRQARARGVDRITALSKNPVDTAERYRVDSVPRIGFSIAETPTADARHSRLDAVLAAALAVAGGEPTALGEDDAAQAVIAAVAASDGVAIAGGGNLSSIWPEHVYERAAFGEIARILGKPLVVSGQTIGPVLFGTDIDLVTRLLETAALVGIREPASLALVRSFGIDLGRAVVDDASFFGPASSAPDRAYCAVTVAAHTGAYDQESYIESFAAMLDHVSLTAGLEIRFFAHFGSTRRVSGLSDVELSIGDTVMHRRILERMTTADVSIAPTTDSDAAASFARGAELVITSRYHPAVFAVSAGVPVIAVPVDGYTTDKLTGALGNFGQHSILPAAELIAGSGSRLVDTVWRDRTAIRKAGLAVAETNRDASDRWWDDVVDVFR